MRIEQITGTVHLVTGTNVNWGLIADGDALTVIDAGYPNDGAALLRSIREIGRKPQDVRAVLLTHAHLDHMGGIPTLLAEHPTPVLTAAAEVPHAHRDHLEQISPIQMVQQCNRKAGIIWVAQTLRAVLPRAKLAIPTAAPVPLDEHLDLPGHPIAVATPGHTTGHTSYFLPDQGVVFTGDALVTAHPLLPGPPKPQFLPDVFSEDEPEMRELSPR